MAGEMDWWMDAQNEKNEMGGWLDEQRGNLVRQRDE